MKKRNLALMIIGTTVLAGSAVVAYIKREAIREAANDIVEKVKRRLKKEQENLVD